jgi:hypothetical protein
VREKRKCTDWLAGLTSGSLCRNCQWSVVPGHPRQIRWPISAEGERWLAQRHFTCPSWWSPSWSRIPLHVLQSRYSPSLNKELKIKETRILLFLRHMNVLYTSHSASSRCILILSSHLHLGLPSYEYLLFSDIPINISCAFLVSPMHSTCYFLPLKSEYFLKRPVLKDALTCIPLSYRHGPNFELIEHKKLNWIFVQFKSLRV